jgi:hypothetical protein
MGAKAAEHPREQLGRDVMDPVVSTMPPGVFFSQHRGADRRLVAPVGYDPSQSRDWCH